MSSVGSDGGACWTLYTVDRTDGAKDRVERRPSLLYRSSRGWSRLVSNSADTCQNKPLFESTRSLYFSTKSSLSSRLLKKADCHR